MHLICKLSKISWAVRAIWLCFWCCGEVGLVVLPPCRSVWTPSGRRWDGVAGSGMIQCSFIKNYNRCLFFLLYPIAALRKQHWHLCVWVKLTQAVVFSFLFFFFFTFSFLPLLVSFFWKQTPMTLYVVAVVFVVCTCFSGGHMCKEHLAPDAVLGKSALAHTQLGRLFVFFFF